MKPWKKLLLYFISLAVCSLFGVAIIMACSGEMDPYDYYTSFFPPDVQGKKGYNAFYFTDYRFTYSDAEPVNEADINSAEWAAYLGAPVKAKDVKEVMYGLDSTTKKDLISAMKQDILPAGRLAGNTFLQTLKQPGHQEALDYYRYALDVEPSTNVAYDVWNPAPIDTTGAAEAAQQALQAAGATTDAFLKLRYYYQAQRQLHYPGSYEQAKDIYDKYIAPAKSQSHVKGWALSWRAGEERRTGDSTLAAYQFSKVFAQYPERRVLAYRNYHYIDAKPEEVLKHARTPEEKANVYAIQGFADPELSVNYLEQVYDNAPSSALVGVLLVREINKLEQYYLTPALSNTSDHFYSSQVARTAVRQQQGSNVKWLLWAGIAILVTGIAASYISFRQQQVKPGFKIASVIIVLMGATVLVWFVAVKPKAGMVTQRLPQGSFFVAMPDSAKTKYDAHIGKLRAFCNRLTDEGKYAEPQIGTLVNAYLCFMQNRTADGLSALGKLDGQAISTGMNDQKQVIKLLLSAQGIKQLDAVNEEALLPALQWLRGKVVAGGKPKPYEYPPVPDRVNPFAITERNFYANILAPAYLRQGDTARAALAMLKSNNGIGSNDGLYIRNDMPDFWFSYLHSGQLQQIINWKNQPKSNRYLAFLSSSLSDVKQDYLYELLGTIKLREHDYAGAAAAFRQIRNGKLLANSYNGEDEYNGDDDSFQGDPFLVDINDYPKAFEGKKYTKLSFAQRMSELQRRVASNPGDADALYQIANGLYNTSTYGNSWGLIAYQWSAYDFGRKSLYYYDSDYVKATLAEQYYLKARKSSQDAELKAKCTFMAAKCEQKQRLAPSYENYTNYDNYRAQEKAYFAALRQNKYFKEMQEFRSTAFYKTAVNECTYLSDFIAGK